MFTITPHAHGFAVGWQPGDTDAARKFRRELLISGLRRTEGPAGVVVARYRNEFETLRTLTALLDRLGFAYHLDDRLVDVRDAGKAEEELVRRLREDADAEEPVPAEVPGFTPSRKLLDYQRVAVAHHLRARHTADFSVPGSGKTTVALAVWASARQQVPELGLCVLGPLSCFRPWEDEFRECFGRSPRAMRVWGSAAERDLQLRHAAHYELLLCSFHTAWREAHGLIEVLKQRPWMLVLDEAHYVKSMTGVLAGTVRQLAPHAVRRMVLTGTPMPRSPEDLWTPYTFLWPTQALLGNAFQHQLLCQKPPDQVCEQLRDQLGPFFHRTCKKDLGLPPIEAEYPAVRAEDVPPEQRLLLRLIERRTLEEADRLSATDQHHLNRWRRARVVRLMQTVSNPLLLAEALDPEQVSTAEDEGVAATDPTVLPLTDLDSQLAAILRRFRDQRVIPAKVRHVIDRVRELAGAGKKVVIWTVFRGNVDLLEQQLRDLRPLVVTGEVPPYEAEDDEEAEKTREQRISLFKTDPERRVLIANAAACAESISLHKVCQHAIYLERSFNAAHFLQSLDRIHRQGMPRGTTAHVEIPHLPCALERVLNRRLEERQCRLYRLLDDPMPVIGFDDRGQRGLFDVEDLEGIDELFAEVLAELRAETLAARAVPAGGS
jgi:hypothetical protein